MLVGLKPRGLFIDRDNRIYVADHTHERILIWQSRFTNPLGSFNVNLSEHSDLFVGMNGEIFLEHRSEAGRIEKWSIERNESVFVAQFDGHCYGLFIDLKNSLYCSQHFQHKVSKISLNADGGNQSALLVAGNGSEGAGAHQLAAPWGIFVDRELNLFVADAENNRIQRFRSGETNGSIVLGQEIPSGLLLNTPTDVIINGEGDFYITDNQNHRVIRVTNEEWTCIAACQNTNGSNANQLTHPYALQLDNRGNLYVADEFNHRIQRFELIRSVPGQ